MLIRSRQIPPPPPFSPQNKKKRTASLKAVYLFLKKKQQRSFITRCFLKHSWAVMFPVWTMELTVVLSGPWNSPWFCLDHGTHRGSVWTMELTVVLSGPWISPWFCLDHGTHRGSVVAVEATMHDNHVRFLLQLLYASNTSPGQADLLMTYRQQTHRQVNYRNS